MTYRTYSAVDLAKEWKRIVNDNVVLMREASMFKRFMKDFGVEPVQMLHGLYTLKGQKSVTPRIFLENYDEWLIPDIWEAELELAIDISGKLPPLYYVYKDVEADELTAQNKEAYEEAKRALSSWKERIIG